MLADRYRIVGRIGRGGMGEVYRADDLKLEQPVSLKFLPPAFAEDPALLERFRGEVRHARQVSHPNVCRVYDIGESDGRHFLSMEYVDGEDLASLLHRIGRLPKTKADEVARQICAGLAAAHDRGVLHRDLKPSNVMIDGDGRVRITDFGLAVRIGENTGELAGTPAYMAPEQFDGKTLTVQSDLYSLGLILYEMYTGHRAFEAVSFVDWKSKHTGSTPTSPSLVDRDIEEAVERLILRCLEKDPARRPSSALQLAAALPGGDPLAAALAAGETPSPEMVAAAGGEGAVAPRVAWSLLGGASLAIAAVLAIAPFSTDFGLAPLTQSSEVLRARAREVVARLGYDKHPRDSETWLTRNYEPMLHLAKLEPSTVWRREIAAWGAPLFLWYRQAPQPMVRHGDDGQIEARDPPLVYSGSVLLSVDAVGRLHDFEAIPPQLDTTSAARAPDWDTLFGLAGLERAAFSEVTPRWTPPQSFDARSEWNGFAPWDKKVPLNVSAAAWKGRPVYFEVRGPWSQPWRMVRKPSVLTTRIAQASLTLLIVVLLLMGVALAQRNLRLGRGDRRGALRFGVFVFIVGALAWLAAAHHVSELQSELVLIFEGIASAMVQAAFMSLMYLALEPYARRRIPELLIGWARVLDGRLRDPRVGRDLLIGGLLGALASVVIHLTNGAPSWIDLRLQTTIPCDYDALTGGRLLVANVLSGLVQALGPTLSTFGLYFLLRVLVKNTWLAAAILILVNTLIGLGGENVLLETPQAILVSVLIALVTARYGLLAAAAFWFFQSVLTRMPLPLDAGAPYAAQSFILIALLAGILLYAFRVALGPRPIFRLALDE